MIPGNAHAHPLSSAQKINADMIVIGAGTLVMIYTDGYMLIGGAIIGAPLAIMAYSVALQSVLSARKHMEKRKARRKINDC